MTHGTKEQAIVAMSRLELDELREIVCDAHKSFYGVKARWAYTWAAESCMDWFLQHYDWDAESGYWTNAVPFQDDGLEIIEGEAFPVVERWSDREFDLQAAYDTGREGRTLGVPLLQLMIGLDRQLKSAVEDGWMAEDRSLRTGV